MQSLYILQAGISIAGDESYGGLAPFIPSTLVYYTGDGLSLDALLYCVLSLVDSLLYSALYCTRGYLAQHTLSGKVLDGDHAGLAHASDRDPEGEVGEARREDALRGSDKGWALLLHLVGVLSVEMAKTEGGEEGRKMQRKEMAQGQETWRHFITQMPFFLLCCFSIAFCGLSALLLSFSSRPACTAPEVVSVL